MGEELDPAEEYWNAFIELAQARTASAQSRRRLAAAQDRMRRAQRELTRVLLLREAIDIGRWEGEGGR